MGKTPASTRAGRKSKSKHPERKWCTCQERCNGGRDVAASTFRSHNLTVTRATTVRGGFEDGLVGGKRKAVDDVDGLGSEGGLRETRRMRARRLAQNGDLTSQPLLTVTEGRTGTLELDDVRPRETTIVGRVGSEDLFFTRTNKRPQHEHREAQAQECLEGDDGMEEEEPSWVPSVEVYPIGNGMDIDNDYEEDDQLRATLRSVNEMVFAILSWD